MAGVPARHLGGEPGLAADHPDVFVEVAAVAPGGVPVLAGHMADDEGGDRGEAPLDVAVEEITEAIGQLLVDFVGTRHEVGPVEERPGHGQAVLPEHGELSPDDLRIVVSPHQRAARSRPEVRAKPVGRPTVRHDPCGIPAHLRPSYASDYTG